MATTIKEALEGLGIPRDYFGQPAPTPTKADQDGGSTTCQSVLYLRAHGHHCPHTPSGGHRLCHEHQGPIMGQLTYVPDRDLGCPTCGARVYEAHGAGCSIWHRIESQGMQRRPTNGHRLLALA